jgi:hypothetical protein
MIYPWHSICCLTFEGTMESGHCRWGLSCVLMPGRVQEVGGRRVRSRNPTGRDREGGAPACRAGQELLTLHTATGETRDRLRGTRTKLWLVD